MRELLAIALKDAGYDVTECAHGAQLADYLLPLYEAESVEFDLIVTDIRMPGISGLEILQGMHEMENWPPMILITAFGDEQTHALAEQYGAAAVLDKPFEMEDLMKAINEALSSQNNGRLI